MLDFNVSVVKIGTNNYIILYYTDCMKFRRLKIDNILKMMDSKRLMIIYTVFSDN